MKNIEAQQHLEAIAKAIAQGDIRVGVAQIRDFQAVYKSVADLSVVEEAESDYRMMADYYRKGLADASRERIFRDIQKKLLQAYGDMAMDYQCRYNAVMAAVTARLAGKRVEVGQARRRLEEFVSDLAMLSLEPEDHTQEKSERLHAAHFDTLRNVFNHLFTSRMWTESDKQNWTALVLSPTIDLNDGLVMTSAIMLGCMMQFDLRKFRSLTEIYSYASDERLRQRALVGWLLAMSKQADVYPEQLPIVRRLLDDERCRSEVGEAQMQMFYCMDADKDSKEIQRDIMPGLIKNSNLRYSDRGFVEKEDDEMEDILHPDARDKAMEDMERGCQRMMDMQRRGSDIYFGGFAQMKRFSFFYSLVNWFMPFNTAHPDLRPVLHKLHNAKLLDAMVKEIRSATATSTALCWLCRVSLIECRRMCRKCWSLATCAKTCRWPATGGRTTHAIFAKPTSRICTASSDCSCRGRSCPAFLRPIRFKVRSRRLTTRPSSWTIRPSDCRRWTSGRRCSCAF